MDQNNQTNKSPLMQSIDRLKIATDRLYGFDKFVEKASLHDLRHSILRSSTVPAGDSGHSRVLAGEPVPEVRRLDVLEGKVDVLAGKLAALEAQFVDYYEPRE